MQLDPEVLDFLKTVPQNVRAGMVMRRETLDRFRARPINRPPMLDPAVLRTAREFRQSRDEQAAKLQKERMAAQRERNITKQYIRERSVTPPWLIGIGSTVLPPVARMVGAEEYADKLYRFADAYEEVARERDVKATGPAFLRRSVRGAVRTIPSMVLAGAAAGPYGAIGVAAMQEADRAITEGKDAGLRGRKLSEYAIKQGVIEGGVASLFQRVGLGGVETMAGGKQAVSAGVTQALKRLGISTLQEVPEEIITELGHNVVAATSGVEPEAMTTKNLMQTAADTTAQTLITMGVVGGPSVLRARTQAQASKHRKEIMDYASQGKVPSRRQWRAWGLPLEEGESRKQRREAVQQLADHYQAVEIANAVASSRAPTEAAWKQLGLPLREGQAAAVEPAAQVELATSPVQPAATMPDVQGLGESAALPTVAEPQGDPMQALGIEQPSEARGMAPMRQDFPVKMEGTGERVSARAAVKNIEQIWGAPIFRGRLRAKGVRGIYKPKRHTSRLAAGEEASVAVGAHEVVGHHFDNTTDVLKSAPADVKREVGKLDYDIKKQRPSEGFAEFMRAYLTGGTETAKGGIDLVRETPKFLAHFEKWLDAHPEYRQKVEATKAPITALKEAGSVGRVLGQISETGIDPAQSDPLHKRAVEWVKFLYWRLKEEGRPISRFTKEAIGKEYEPGGDTTPFEDFNALRQIGPHFARTAIENGVFLINPEGAMRKIGPSMVEALADIEPGEDYTNFLAWAYARHAIESWHRGKNPGITMEDAQDAMRRLQDARYERAANMLTEFNNALIAVLIDVGAIDAKTGDKILGEYEYYIPLERAVGKRRPGGGGRRLVDLGKAIKGRRGSGFQIIDPVEATLSRAIRLYERAAKQVVMNKLIAVAKSTRGMGGWIDEVSPKITPTHFKFDEIKPQLLGYIVESSNMSPEAAGELLDAIDPIDALTVWRPDLMKVHGEPIVRVIVDGKPQLFQVHPELIDALGGLDTLTALDPVTKVARACTGFLKIGATRANVDFVVSNAARDLQTFLMQGEKGLAGVFDPARYAIAYVAAELNHAAGKKGSPLIELFLRMGGELSTYAGLDRARLRKGVSRALAGRQGKLETAASIVGVSEMGPRIAEFAAILDNEGWLQRAQEGEMPPMPVLIRAINAAHDVTVDFRRMGKWGRYLNYYIPFFNARLEGLDKFVRTFKDHPGRSTMRAAMNIVPLAMMYWWYRHDDDDYKERPEWQDGFFVLKDEQGRPRWRVPKSQEWGLIETGVERIMDLMYDKDPEAVSRWFGQAWDVSDPMSLPAGATPFFETWFNYDAFRERPIVSDQLRKLEGPDQYYDYTSSVAKRVSRVLHNVSGGKVSLSPAKLDHLANGLSGGLYGKINAPMEKIASGELPFGSDWRVSDTPGLKSITLRKEYFKSVDDFYHVKELLDKAHESAKLRGKESAEPEKRRRMSYAESLMADIRKAARNLPAEEQEAAGRALAGLARAALGREPLDSYPNPMANPDDLPAAIAEVVRKHVAQKAVTASGRPDSPTTQHAQQYLSDMGIHPQVAGELAFMRLLSQGVSSATASRRAGNLRSRSW